MRMCVSRLVRHRPADLSGVIGNSVLTSQMQEYCQAYQSTFATSSILYEETPCTQNCDIRPSLPHVLLRGSNHQRGNGKTLALTLFLRQLSNALATPNHDAETIWLSISVGEYMFPGGEQTLLNIVSAFAGQSLQSGIRERFILVDGGIEQLSISTQLSLVGFVQEYQHTTRFLFVSNASTFEPSFLTYCVEWMWTSPSVAEIAVVLKTICEKENCKASSDQVLQHIAIVADGSVKQAILLLEDAACIAKTRIKKNTTNQALQETTITEEDVSIAAKTPEERRIAQFAEFLLQHLSPAPKTRENSKKLSCTNLFLTMLDMTADLDVAVFAGVLGAELHSRQQQTRAIPRLFQLSNILFECQRNLKGRNPKLCKHALLAKFCRFLE